MVIAVVLDSDFNMGLGILEGVRDAIRHCPGWQLVVIPQAQESILERLLRERRVDGVIGAFISDRWLEGLPEPRIPMINTSTLSAINTIPGVVTDEAGVGRRAALHLRRLGLSTFCCLAEQASFGSRLRRDRFVSEIALHKGSRLVEAPLNEGVLRRPLELDDWIRHVPKPCGIFCTSDHLARRVIASAERTGLRIPQALAVVGAGDNPSDVLLSSVALSSVPIPAYRIGIQAVRSLERLFAGETVSSAPIAPDDVVVRASSAHVWSGDAAVSRALGLIEQKLNEPPDIAELARLSGVSRRGLETRFMRWVGRSPATEWRRRQIEQATALLQETPMSLDEIADRTGWSSASHLSAAFKRAGLSAPGHFRKKAKANLKNVSRHSSQTTRKPTSKTGCHGQ